MFDWLRSIFEGGKNNNSTTHRKPPIKSPLTDPKSDSSIPETPQKKYEYLVQKYVDLPLADVRITSNVIIKHDDSKYQVAVRTSYSYIREQCTSYSYIREHIRKQYTVSFHLFEIKILPRNKVEFIRECTEESKKCHIVTSHLDDVIKSLIDINDQIEKSNYMTKKKEKQLEICNERLGKKLQELELKNKFDYEPPIKHL